MQFGAQQQEEQQQLWEGLEAAAARCEAAVRQLDPEAECSFTASRLRSAAPAVTVPTAAPAAAAAVAGGRLVAVIQQPSQPPGSMRGSYRPDVRRPLAVYAGIPAYCGALYLPAAAFVAAAAAAAPTEGGPLSCLNCADC